MWYQNQQMNRAH